MKYESKIEQRGSLVFPSFEGDRVYMREFFKSSGLPADLSRWQPTVDAMLEGVETDLPIYLMVDEAPVKRGNTHRRHGLHIDGYWNPAIYAHGGSSPYGHNSNPSVDYGSHGATNISGHRASPNTGRHGHSPSPARHFAGAASWQEADFSAKEAIILASSLSSARGLVGEFDGIIGDGGDCSAIEISGLTVLPMEAGIIYAGNVTALHESLPVSQDCFRQLVRLNVPGWHH